MTFLFSGILLRIFLRFPGMLLLQDVLLMSFNLVLFNSLLTEKSIVVMSWDFSLEFPLAIFLSTLTERFDESYLNGFVYSDENFVQPLL